MSLTSKEELLGRTKRRFKDIEHAGYGLKLRLRSLNDREKSTLDSGSLTKGGDWSKESAQAQKRRTVVACVVDADGEPYFTESDVKALEELDGGIVSWITEQARAHCNLDAGVADAEKNSVATGGSGSHSN